MPVFSAAKSSSLVGGISGRPARARPAIKDQPAIIREGLRQLIQDMDAIRNEPQALRRGAMERVAQDIAPPPKPALDRAAFVRELSRIASFVERYSVPASLIYMQLERLDAIAERHGPAAAAAAATKVADTLTTRVRETDFVGRLGESGFGILLAKATEAEAAAKADMLSELVKASPVIWEGRAIQLSVSIGALAL